MLKYFDVARLVGAGIKCSACGGTRCRGSRWHSKDEKLSNQGSRPYRCEDCENRFLADSGAALERTLINSVAYVILGISILTAVELWPRNDDKPAAGRVESVSVADTAESTDRSRDGGEAPSQIDKEIPVANGHPEDVLNNLALLEKAAADGHVGAMIHLAQVLAAGNGYPKDTKKAAKWMRVAAAAGNAEGMFGLGRYYRDGVGLPQDAVRAYVWLNRAAAAGHPSAMQVRDDLVRKMSAEELSEAHHLVLSESWHDSSGARKQ